MVWNMRGVCEEEKRVQVVNVFEEGRLNLLALSKTNLKGNEEFI